MTRKDYVMIAKAISKARCGAYFLTLHCFDEMAKELALEFSADNPKFNCDKFLKACGVVI